MRAVILPFKIPASTARFTVLDKIVSSPSWMTMRARNKLKVRGAMPQKSSSTPMAAFQSASTRVRREVSASKTMRSFAAHSRARIMTEGGIDGPPWVGE